MKKLKDNIGWVNNWQIREKIDCHPSSAVKVIEMNTIIEEIEKYISDEDIKYDELALYKILQKLKGELT